MKPSTRSRKNRRASCCEWLSQAVFAESRGRRPNKAGCSSTWQPPSATRGPRFEAAARKAAEAVASLPECQFNLDLREGSCAELDVGGLDVPLVICHPPYFNLYRYSSITSLEGAWLGHDIRAVQKKEVREFFKVGKPGNVTRYVEDMQRALRNIRNALRPDGILALMVGDTAIHGNRIQTTRLLVEAVRDVLTPVKVSIRTPKFTEASWAASQRRTGEKVGVAMTDFIIHFRRAV